EWISRCSLRPCPFPTHTCILSISEPRSRSSGFRSDPETCCTPMSTGSSPFRTILPNAFPKWHPESAPKSGRLSTSASRPNSHWKSYCKPFRPSDEDIHAKRCLQALCLAIRHGSGLPDLRLFEARASSGQQCQGGRCPYRGSRQGVQGGPLARPGADCRIQAVPRSRRDGEGRRLCETDQRRCRRSREAGPTLSHTGDSRNGRRPEEGGCR